MERSQNTLGRWKNWSTCKWFHIEAVMICFQNILCQYSYRSLSQEILLKIPRMFWVSLKNIKWISMIHGLYLEKRQIGFCYLKNDEHFYRIGVLEVSVHPMQLNALIIHSWTWKIVLVWHIMDRKQSRYHLSSFDTDVAKVIGSELECVPLRTLMMCFQKLRFSV